MQELEFQDSLAKANIHIPIVFMTGHGDIPMTVRAMKAGAVEFLTKPFRDQDMLDAVQLAIERDRKRRNNEGAGRELNENYGSLYPARARNNGFGRGRPDEQANRGGNRSY